MLQHQALEQMGKTIKGTVVTSLERYFAAVLEKMAETIKGTLATSLERYFAAALQKSSKVESFHLGFALCSIHRNYIVIETLPRA